MVAVLAYCLGMRLGPCLAVGEEWDDQDQTQGADRQQDPPNPAKAASVLGLCFRDGFNLDIFASTLGADHFEPSIFRT
jgi:hypothetical protein